MKKLLTLLMAVVLCFTVNAQTTTKTMNWDDSVRQYIEYIPASYNANSPAPVLFILHGLGDDMNNMFYGTGFQTYADQHGWILITPQATEAVVSLMGQSFSLGTAWNSGIQGSVYGMTIAINPEVDDSGFLMAILDDLVAHYNVDQEHVFVTGFSMGGFMSHRMAIEHADRIKAIAAVSGTIGNMMQDQTPVGNVSVMHIHGTADGMVGYDGNMSMQGITMQIGLGAEATVDFWRNFNQCSATPNVHNFNDNADDGLTFEQYEYTGGQNGTKTVFIKCNGGDHQWYSSPTNDIDYTAEIFDFFHSFVRPTSLDENSIEVSIYPNPASDVLHVSAEEMVKVAVYDMTGRQVYEGNQQEISLTTLTDGLYLVQVTLSNGRVINQKISVMR